MAVRTARAIEPVTATSASWKVMQLNNQVSNEKRNSQL
jgi:hypothetical protein